MIEADTVTNEELLELDVDLLVPAALENQIIEANAARVKAPVIVELANGSHHQRGDRILADKGALVVPDILANAAASPSATSSGPRTARLLLDAGTTFISGWKQS